jgi:hypothetical protein
MNSLKKVLLINGLSSGATGLLLWIFSAYTAKLFGTADNVPFIVVGIFLVLFSVIVIIQAARKTASRGWIRLIIALDIIWVIESLFILVPKMFDLTTIGYLLIAGVAAWVALMAVLQIRGLKRTSLKY